MQNTKFKQRAGVSALALALSWVSGMAVLNAPWVPVHAASNQVTSEINASVYSEAELDRLLAPVALYPDSLLTHILIAATYPLEVVQAERWAQKHAHLKPQQALELATNEPWDESVKALVGTPDVLKQMSDDLTWTQAVGEAFLAQQEDVLDRVQALRAHAFEAGNLKSNEHVSVERAERTIVIENVRREVVYVPYYDTRVVYGSWWHNHPPVYWARPSLTVSIGSGIYWGISYHVPSYFYFSHFFWPQRYVVINHHYYSAPPKKRRDYYMTKHDGKRWNHNPRHRRGVEYRHRDLQPSQPKYHMVRGEAPVREIEIIEPKARPKIADLKRDLREQPKPIKRSEVRQPIVRQPQVRQPEVRQPIVRQPQVRQPEVRQPIIRQPQVRQPEVRQPIIRQPEVRQPIIRQPEVRQPIIRQPQVRQPEVRQQIVRQPRVRQPSYTQPVKAANPSITGGARSERMASPSRVHRGNARDH